MSLTLIRMLALGIATATLLSACGSNGTTQGNSSSVFADSTGYVCKGTEADANLISPLGNVVEAFDSDHEMTECLAFKATYVGQYFYCSGTQADAMLYTNSYPAQDTQEFDSDHELDDCLVFAQKNTRDGYYCLGSDSDATLYDSNGAFMQEFQADHSLADCRTQLYRY